MTLQTMRRITVVGIVFAVLIPLASAERSRDERTRGDESSSPEVEYDDDFWNDNSHFDDEFVGYLMTLFTGAFFVK